MRYRVKVEWENEDGNSETAELGQVETGPCLAESEVGLKLVAAQKIMFRLQRVVTTQQLSIASRWRLGMVRFMRSTCPLVQGWLGLISRCSIP
jgi:hypothetical protein